MADPKPEPAKTVREMLIGVFGQAIDSWPNKPWLVLPGPVDLGPQLAAHLADHWLSRFDRMLDDPARTPSVARALFTLTQMDPKP